MLENKKLYKVKTQVGVRKFAKFDIIRTEYLSRSRGVKRMLANYYAGIGGPRRKAWMIHLKMKSRFGIGLNRS